MAQEGLESSPAARLGDIANEVVVCLEVPAGAVGEAGLGPLDGMPALTVPREDGGPEVLAHFARSPRDAEGDPDGWHAVSHAGHSWVSGSAGDLDVPPEVAAAFGRAYGGPPGWRSPGSYLG